MMCGLAGVIFGAGHRDPDDLEHLMSLFTRLLVLSQQRGPHATGIASLDMNGQYRLFKRPIAATQFVQHKAFRALLGGIDERTTLLLGHTRWRTRGDERINRNNHPIRAGHVLGIHNGTIYNADDLFRRYRLSRFAEVDSEILFRMARTRPNGRIDVAGLRKRLRHCRGQIAAVMASRRDPNTVLVLKGNNPIALRWNPRLRVVLCASTDAYLDAALADETNWTVVPASTMTAIAFNCTDLTAYTTRDIAFVAQATDRSDIIDRYRQFRLDDF